MAICLEQWGRDCTFPIQVAQDTELLKSEDGLEMIVHETWEDCMLIFWSLLGNEAL